MISQVLLYFPLLAMFLFKIIPFFRGGEGKGLALSMVLFYLIQMRLQKSFTLLCSCRLGISDLLGCLGQLLLVLP